jgi:hypothetical protein
VVLAISEELRNARLGTELIVANSGEEVVICDAANSTPANRDQRISSIRDCVYILSGTQMPGMEGRSITGASCGSIEASTKE